MDGLLAKKCKKYKKEKQLLKLYILYIYVDDKLKNFIHNFIFILTLLTTFTNTRGN